MTASLTRAVIGTLAGIRRTLTLAEVSDADLYAVADALQDARNGVLEEALDRLALAEGRRLVAVRALAHSRPDGA